LCLVEAFEIQITNYMSMKKFFNLQDHILKTSGKKLPEAVWVDCNDKIAWAKGIKRQGGLTYQQWREVGRTGGYGADSQLKVTLPDGESFCAPFRMLSQEEIQNRIKEILQV